MSGRSGSDLPAFHAQSAINCAFFGKSKSMSMVAVLAETRKHQGLTQAALAEGAGLSRMTVQRIESGDIDPRLSTLQEMARVLGLDLMAVPAAQPSVADPVGRADDGAPR
jgi:DNA-binding XRE family transcriptional regulator